MDFKKFGLCLALVVCVMFGSATGSRASEIHDKFVAAYDKNDKKGMTAVVKENLAAVPAEIAGMLTEAAKPTVSIEDRGSILYIAELMAGTYKDLTGDIKPLLNVKKRAFETRLSKPVRLEVKDGIAIINIPKASGEMKNYFSPDNVIIKQGDTVRWMNHDEVSHIFATMPLISAGKFFSTSVGGGKSWDFKFDKPGEYYYLCFIHQSMVGKITVEGTATVAPAAPAAAPAAEPAAPEGGPASTAPADKTVAPAPAAAPETVAPAPSAPADKTVAPADNTTGEETVAPADEPAGGETMAPAPDDGTEDPSAVSPDDQSGQDQPADQDSTEQDMQTPAK